MASQTIETTTFVQSITFEVINHSTIAASNLATKAHHQRQLLHRGGRSVTNIVRMSSQGYQCIRKTICIPSSTVVHIRAFLPVFILHLTSLLQTAYTRNCLKESIIAIISVLQTAYIGSSLKEGIIVTFFSTSEIVFRVFTMTYAKEMDRTFDDEERQSAIFLTYMESHNYPDFTSIVQWPKDQDNTSRCIFSSKE